MTEQTPISAGALLREARERRGIDIGMLSAALKVSPRKLQALEADRHDELPDPVFTRSLAMSVCRLLGADPAPVLALLPQACATPSGLERVTVGLQAPFDSRYPDDRALRAWSPRHPSLVAGAALLVAAAVGLWFLALDGPVPTALSAAAVEIAPALPAASSGPAALGPTLDAASGVASGPAGASSAVLEIAASVSAVPGVAPEGLSDSSIAVTAPSWVEVRDGNGKLRWSRLLAAGEVAPLAGPPPVRLVIGNARATKVVFAGRVVDLGPSTRDNVARLELQ